MGLTAKSNRFYCYPKREEMKRFDLSRELKIIKAIPAILGIVILTSILIIMAYICKEE
jgi:hypothetical protein